MNEERGVLRPKAAPGRIAVARDVSLARMNGLVMRSRALLARSSRLRSDPSRQGAKAAVHSLRKDAAVAPANRVALDVERAIPRPALPTRALAATLSLVISLGLFLALTHLFVGEGPLWQELVAAERACAHLAYVSERQVCVRAQVAASDARTVARR